jgi:hypothetical protein
MCGLAIGDYHHIDPEFPDAGVHDPAKMAFLCENDHRKTRGMLSRKTVLEARRNPVTFQRGCAKEAFDFREPFELFVGDSHFHDVHCVIRKERYLFTV